MIRAALRDGHSPIKASMVASKMHTMSSEGHFNQDDEPDFGATATAEPAEMKYGGIKHGMPGHACRGACMKKGGMTHPKHSRLEEGGMMGEPEHPGSETNQGLHQEGGDYEDENEDEEEGEYMARGGWMPCSTFAFSCGEGTALKWPWSQNPLFWGAQDYFGGNNGNAPLHGLSTSFAWTSDVVDMQSALGATLNLQLPSGATQAQLIVPSTTSGLGLLFTWNASGTGGNSGQSR